MQAKDFHAKCDRKGPTITFIQLKNGPLIGGFTTAHWKNCRDSDFVNDRYSFIFNLTEKKNLSSPKLRKSNCKLSRKWSYIW